MTGRFSFLSRPRRVAARRLLQAAVIVLPAGYASAGDHAFVTNQPDNSLAIVDLDRMVVLDTIAIGGNPAGIALSLDGKKAFVTSPESKTLTTIDAVNRKIAGQLTVGKGPVGVAVHPGGAHVYVADWYTHSVLAVNVEANKVIAEIPVGQSPSGVAVTPDGKTIVTADRDSNQISLIDAESLKVKATVPVGDRPFGVTIDDSGTLAFTANVQSDDVSVVNLAQLKRIATIKAGKRPYAIALAAGKGFVTNQYAGTLTVFDARTFAVIDTIPIGEYPEGIARSSDGRYVYIANWFDNELAKLSTDSLKISGAVKTGEVPRAFGSFVRASDPKGD